jgi:hypothetical protein
MFVNFSLTFKFHMHSLFVLGPILEQPTVI